ncbi:MAG: hypothetical protein V3T84_05610 [Phycisphaerales bacterium]
MKYLTALTTALLSTASVAWAGSLNRDAIPVAAQWVVHIDVEAMNGSEVGACLIKGLQSQEDNPLNTIEAELGISLLEDLYSLTAYGFGEPPAKEVAVEVTDEDVSIGAIARPGENTVILAVTNDAVDNVIEQLSADAQRYKKITRDGHTIHAWSDDDGEEEWLLFTQTTKGDARRVVLASNNVDALLAGIKTLVGDAPSLGDNDDADEMASPRTGSILFASANDVGELAEQNGASAILQQTDKITLDISEQAGLVNLTLAVRAKNAEAAATITQILQGVIAMATLALDPDAEETASIRALTQSLQFSSDGRRMSLEIEQPAEVVCQLLEMLQDDAEFGLDMDRD